MANLANFPPAAYPDGCLAGKELNIGAGLLKRILLTLVVACGLLLLFAPDADATPIRPDIRSLVAQPPQVTPHYMPARAGWDGPEMQPIEPAILPAQEKAAGLARAERAELIAAAIPDPGIVLGIGALIFLLRLLRRREEQRVAAMSELVPAASMPIPVLEADRRIA